MFTEYRWFFNRAHGTLVGENYAGGVTQTICSKDIVKVFKKSVVKTY